MVVMAGAWVGSKAGAAFRAVMRSAKGQVSCFFRRLDALRLPRRWRGNGGMGFFSINPRSTASAKKPEERALDAGLGKRLGLGVFHQIAHQVDLGPTGRGEARRDHRQQGQDPEHGDQRDAPL